MTDKQINCFLIAAKELNFTKAAEQLFLTQPAVSRYIASLENELGVELFCRSSNKKLALTEKGKVYYNMFLRFSLEFKDTNALMKTDYPVLHFGYNSGWSIPSILRDTILACKRIEPQFKLTLDCLHLEALIESLNEETLDAILTIENNIAGESWINYERVASIGRKILYSDYLISPEQITGPEDFANYYFLISDDRYTQRVVSHIESFGSAYDFIPKLKTVANTDSVIANVASGLGIAFYDEWGQGISEPHMHTYDINNYHHICLVWKAMSSHPSIPIFRDALKARLGQ